MSVDALQSDDLARELVEKASVFVLPSLIPVLQVELEESGKTEVLKAIISGLIRNNLVLSNYHVDFQVVSYTGTPEVGFVVVAHIFINTTKGRKFIQFTFQIPPGKIHSGVGGMN
ncbi:hypothetical protein COW94_04220 [Candidatus Peregrinibacteria bacterium CG22_combo_CG10-13_8_21_14_all_44_10]|nr:MAG: hypothetical protein AUK45_05270 [Candidatus Peregrinibacteria bacterium CG2_30_44_17]PIP65986.1 MAG: hypothetical protein COW94_04220 [Candidatus Peregrinibacteria bacterium CG22_combo_CG10-13_8_21_14_all_44_10]PIX79477.1 MAG: hypothetical protein COZ35_03480 [Candidatus Peregrinibacteria bacterium CG_4_10_14_3_um_filter_44_21]PJB88698.1 MAG: hypothetical protein CO082_03610 [Candidatus Peregrinibacteria bacterium CG_4_9_14_0_8_um_filter_44_15]